MPCHLPPSYRDIFLRLFRADVYRRVGYVEFPHQAQLRLATEGLTLTDLVVEEPSEEWQMRPLVYDKDQDYSIQDTPVQVMLPCLETDPGAFLVEETGNYAHYQWQLAVPRVANIKGVLVSGVIAHKAADMAGFKGGKSKGAGLWATGFACLPGAEVDMVGLEYVSSEHEFTYLVEALLSGKDAPVKKYKHLYNDVRGGRMFLELSNGCKIAARSWTNKDTMRGGQKTAYLWNEAYQLPGLESYTGHSQNLRRERGYSLWTTTPDRPWVQVLHKRGHGADPDWVCICGNTGYVNPYVFSLTDFMADAPDWSTIMEHAPELMPLCLDCNLEPGRLMSKEKFLISWLGKMGEFVGRVYQFQQGKLLFNPSTHPTLFKKPVVERWTAVQAHLAALQETSHAVTAG